MQPIYDTMNGGLMIDADKETLDALGKLKNANGVIKDKDGTYGYKSVLNDNVLTISLYNGKNNDRWFTTLTISWKSSRGRWFINVKANGTAITNKTFAYDISKKGPMTTLLAPFYIIEDIYGNIYSENVWSKIVAGDVSINDLEIAFYFHSDLSKQTIIRMFALMYNRDISLQDVHVSLAKELQIVTRLYPEQFTRFDQPFTGIMMQRMDGTNRLLTLNIYDKVAQMLDTGRMTDIEAKKELPKNSFDFPRFDIRLFRRELKMILEAHGIHDITVAGWVDFHKKVGRDNLCIFCLERALDRLYFDELTKHSITKSTLRRAITKQFPKFLPIWMGRVNIHNVKAEFTRLGYSPAEYKKYIDLCESCEASPNIGHLAHRAVEHASQETLGELNDLIDGTLNKKISTSNQHIPAYEWFGTFKTTLDGYSQKEREAA